MIHKNQEGLDTMTENPCNCETCDNKSRWYCPKWDGKINREREDISLWKMDLTVRNFTKVHGCLSHPKAREYLNKEVIEELERLKETTVPTKQIMTFDEVINLLKEGITR